MDLKIIRNLIERHRNSIPMAIRKPIFRIGRFLIEEEQFPSLASTLKALKKRGFSPVFAIDVGAYHGEWSQFFKDCFPAVKILMVEAQESKNEILDGVVKQFPGDLFKEVALLGSSSLKNVRFVEMETGSSVFEEHSHYQRRYVEKEQVKLDDLLQKYSEFSHVDFLKLDVQGYELEVLKGADEVLKNTQLVFLEVSLIPINENCPIIGDVFEFMKEKGFRLLDFCSQIRRRDGFLWQTDLLFIRNDSQWNPIAKLDRENWG